jgi:cell wall-associated NlpC family hydrolase
MEQLEQAVEAARAVLSGRYRLLLDTTSWSHDENGIHVTGGVLVAAQATFYSEFIRDEMGLAVPRPAVLSALDCDWESLEWRELPEGQVIDLHRGPSSDDLQTQWTGPAFVRWFADEDSRSLIQLPDGTLGWTARTSLLQAAVSTDPWASIVRPEKGQSIPVTASLDGAAIQARLRLGNPYLWGGNTFAAADCSGLVQDLVYRNSGVLLPKHTADQRKHGARVPASSIQPGDLVFVRGRERSIGHVGLALPGSTENEVTVVHSCLTKNKVMEEPLASFLSRYRFTGGRRPVQWNQSS